MADARFEATLDRLGLVPTGEGARRRIPLPVMSNIAAETLGLHAAGPRAGAAAVRFEAADGGTAELAACRS